MNRARLIPLLSILLFFSSCNFFDDVDYIYFPVEDCCQGPDCTVTGSIPEVEARVILLQSNVQGQYFNKWLILPKSPSNKIYEACNLPDTLKKDWNKVWITGNFIIDANNPPDTTIGGIQQIELTSIFIED